MIIETSRFGRVKINPAEILNFTEGLLGFADLKKFVILDDPNDDIFAWLQSCDLPEVAFPVLEPELFAENYKINLSKGDLDNLKLTESKACRSFSIITIPEDPTQMTANMKAPIVINIAQKLGRQCVLQDNNLAIREPIFVKLQQRVVANPSQSIKNQSAGMDFAIKIERDAEI